MAHHRSPNFGAASTPAAGSATIGSQTLTPHSWVGGRRQFCYATLAALLLTSASLWAGPDIIEGDDAGSLPGSAKKTTGFGPLQGISGHLGGLPLVGPADFEDMYLIRIANPALFSATTSGGATNFNTQLWLFQASGLGLLGNDNGPSPPSSLLLPTATDGTGATVAAAGLYYLAVSGFNNDPHSITGAIFNQLTLTEISGPDGPGGSMMVSSWPILGATGDYTITLTGCEFAQLPDYVETGDAGEIPGSAQVPTGSGPLDSIGGSLVALAFGGADLEDMFLIKIVDPEGFRASTTGGLVTFDTQLWLFDDLGRGLLGNDDDPAFDVGTSILLSDSNDGSGSGVTEPGLYYLAISGSDHDPLGGGQPLFNQASITEISGPDGPGGSAAIGGWSGSGGQGNYVIFLEGVEYPRQDIPAASGIGLAVLAGALLAAAAVVIARRRAAGTGTGSKLPVAPLST